MKNFKVILIIAVICMVVTACQPSGATLPPASPTTAPVEPTSAPAQPTTVPVESTAPPAAKEPFVVAVVGPMTGGGAQQGEYAMAGAQIAVDQINAAGGINGQQVKLLPMDDQGDPAVAATVAQTLISDPTVQVVVGHLWSSGTLAAEPLYVKAGMPVITPSSSNIQVTTSGWQNILRMTPNESYGTPPPVAVLVNNFKVKKIAVLYSNDDFGVGSFEQVKKTAAELGAEVVYGGAYKPNVDTDFTVQLTAAVAAGADGVFLASQQTEGGLILSQAEQLGVFDKIKYFVGSDGLIYQAFLDRLDAKSEGFVYVVAPYDPFATDRPVMTNFVQKFWAAKNNATPSETAWFSYDAMIMIKDGYAAGATKATLIDKLKTMTFTDLLTGASIKFNQAGDRQNVDFYVIGVKDGKFYSTGIKPDFTGVTLGQ